MIIRKLVVGPLQANCYIVRDESSAAAAVIDPGGDGEIIREALQRGSCRPVALINTHGHIDHIAANAYLKKAYDVPLMIHAADAPFLADPSLNLSLPGLEGIASPPPDRLLSAGDEIRVGAITLTVIATPGHSPGSICLIARAPEGGEVVFTGDTLFAGGVGRTDFPGGSSRRLLESIKKKLLTLPEETAIYPGHGPPSTIGEEKHSNIFLTSFSGS